MGRTSDERMNYLLRVIGELGKNELSVRLDSSNAKVQMIRITTGGAQIDEWPVVQKWSTATVIYCRERISRQLFSVIEAGVMERPSTTVFENCRNRLFYDMK